MHWHHTWKSSEIVADIDVPRYWCDEYLQQFNNSECYRVRYLLTWEKVRVGRSSDNCALKNTLFRHVTVRFHSSVGVTPVHLLDTHIMRTTTCLDLKAQDQLSPFVLFKYSHTLPSPWPKCWLHTNSPTGRRGKKKIKWKVNTGRKKKLPFASTLVPF